MLGSHLGALSGEFHKADLVNAAFYPIWQFEPFDGFQTAPIGNLI